MTSPDSRSPFGPSWTPTVRWVGPGLAVVALALWCAAPTGALLAVAAVGAGAGAMAAPRRMLHAAGIALLLAGILGGFQAHRQVGRVQGAWQEYWAEREAEVGESLDEALQSLLEAGETAVADLAELGRGPGPPPEPEALTELRDRHGVTAMALYDGQGELRVWDGTHRGLVPGEVQLGLERYTYSERPLFGYLYITAPAGDGTAVAAFLLRTNLPPRLAVDAEDFASSFREEVGERIRLFSVPLTEGQGGWELEVDDRVLVSVVLEPPRTMDRADEILLRWRGIVFGLVLLAWILFTVGSAGGRVGAVGVGGLVLLAAAAPVPPAAEGVGALFDPTLFLTPGPLDVTLGRLLLLVLAVMALVAVLPRPRLRLSPAVAGAVGGLATTLTLAWLHAGLAPGALARGPGVWVAYQAVGVGVVALLVGAAVALSGPEAPRRRRVVAGVAGAFVLGAGTGVHVWVAGAVPVWWPLLWTGPVALVASGVERWSGWVRPAAAWGAAVLVSATATIPLAWGHRVEARIDAGEARLERLAAPADARLEADLGEMARQARLLDGRGQDGVDLLYGALQESGFAEAGHPVWLTLWSPAGVPREELRVGVGAGRPAASLEAVNLPRDSTARILMYGRDDARYVLRVPLEGGRTLTAAAPPFADRARSALSPLLAGGGSFASDSLTMIPREARPVEVAGRPSWLRTDEGWRGERIVAFPGVVYDAHYLVPLPGVLLAVARGTLLLVLDGLVLLLFWVGGRALMREPRPPHLRLGELAISFRARVTMALFGFFVLANALFGTLAYTAIADTSERAAQVLAARVADDAAGWYFEESGAMELLARRVGAELLEFREGALREGSVEELVELGLYEAWLPYRIHRELESGESVRAFQEESLGEWAYVTAFRRLPDGDLLGAPVPLQAGATAIGSTDVLQLLGFAVLVGAALSLGLALLVGQALTRPLQALQVASERVGAGNLRLRLPDRQPDEFGAVFRAFNRMVKRLRRARRQLVRTTRRTQAIMEEAAVGIVALDPGGRVTLVNPRAEGLLETDLPLGEQVPDRGPVAGELRAWLDAYLREADGEAGFELHIGDRRIRVRARRLEGGNAPGGVVVALEDVTDELRTERVLAWGEMAQQVAHEVKNPLTPMKLGIQHIRRAWEDGRPDFDQILVRNADAVLREIDRLAAIAQSFGRFGAPAQGLGAPLEPVDVAAVIQEVMALYGASDGPVRFHRDVPPDLPTVRGRVPELKEVLVNLLENARDALREEGGNVVVEARALPGGDVLVEVRDDGAGIPAELMPRVFEPHFSTRSGGTGLGLAIVRRLAESWGGSVSLESDPGTGTNVALILGAWRDQG